MIKHFGLFILFSSCVWAKSLPKDTAIDRLSVARFGSTTNNPKLNRWWNERAVRLQKLLLQQLREKSYLEAHTIEETLKPSDERASFRKTAKELGSDGILAGDFKGRTIEVALKSSSSGNTLASWTFPVSISAQDFEKNFIDQAVTNIVTSFPYRGYVLSVRGNEAMVNVGKGDALKAGTILDVIEFEGDNPSFSSPLTPIGRLAIVSVSKNFAKTKILNGKEAIKPFSKVAFSKDTSQWEDLLTTRTTGSFWVGAGTDFFFIDSQVTDSAGPLGKRIYQIPLAPFLALEAGYNRFRATYVSGGASNDSNKVKFLKVSGSYQFYESQGKKWGYLHSIGIYHQNFSSEVKANARYPLTSFSLTTPYYELRAQTLIGSQLIYWVSGQLYYPVSSMDSENGSSELFTSAGLGVESGVRLSLSELLAVESGLKGLVFRQQMNNGGILELQYGLFLRMLLFF